MKINEQSFYDILGVSPTATLKEIKLAYRQKCKEYHPDTNPGDNNGTYLEMMYMINEAYSVLRVTESRRVYDEMLIYDEMLKSSDQYYCSDDTSHVKEQSETSNSKDNTARPYDDIEYYRFYDSVDFDQDIQEEFIIWMEEYLDYFIKYCLKNNLFKNDDLFTKIYDTFKNNIENEKELSKKKIRMNM